MKYTQLTEGERYQIYGLLKAGFSQKQIAQIFEHSLVFVKQFTGYLQTISAISPVNIYYKPALLRHILNRRMYMSLYILYYLLSFP